MREAHNETQNREAKFKAKDSERTITSGKTAEAECI
jgi:hypothetical protein